MFANITNKLQTLVNRYLQGIMGARWSEITSNTDGAVGSHWRESCNVTNRNEKMAMDGSHCETGR